VALDTQSLVLEANNLAPLPQAAVRLVSILSREDWDVMEVLEVVRLDPILTGKVLGAANSASSGTQAKILEVNDAVRRVGPRAVVGLALATGVKGRLSTALPQFGLGEGELWKHSVAALLAAELAGTHFRLGPSTVATTAALLHDVGKVLMARFLDPETLDFLTLARVEGGETGREAELEILTVTHGELGGLIAAHWGMPEEIVRAVQYHHDLGNTPAAFQRDAAIVQLADAAAKVVAPPRFPGLEDASELDQALAVLGVQREAFPDFCEAAKVRFQKLGQAF
jgi:putative nucleotidyltransferase with HDIG domain